jgi:hypothetical protein
MPSGHIWPDPVDHIRSRIKRSDKEMTRTTWKLPLALIACLLLALPVAAKDIARVTVDSGGLVFTPEAATAGFKLTVTGPDGYVYSETFDGGGVMTWAASAADGGMLTDGPYNYELVPVAHAAKRSAAAELSAAKAEYTVLSGTVTVRGGSLVDPELPEGPLTKDQVILDDLIVDGSLCVGIDCVNNENFGFDTIRLKENNLRIKFEDTSTGTFPSNDWQLTANDSANGGASFFSIDDVTNSRTPFKVTAGAPTNSFFMASDGDVGFGTASPAINGVHIADGNTPALRLEQNGSSGFAAQTWDIAGNETNFFVRDVTNGSTLPFRIRPGAPSSSIDIAASGDVGVGTASPSSSLHVRRTDGTAKVLVEETNATAADRNLLEMTNKGGTLANFENSNVSGFTNGVGAPTWQFGLNANGQFIFNVAGSGGQEMVLAPGSNGGMTLFGTLTVTGGGGGTVPDYVFAPNYELMPLSQLAAFIAENQHLPNVPSATEIEENGLDMTTMQMRLLEKVEELTLYILQQQKTIDAFQERIQAAEPTGE